MRDLPVIVLLIAVTLVAIILPVAMGRHSTPTKCENQPVVTAVAVPVASAPSDVDMVYTCQNVCK